MGQSVVLLIIDGSVGCTGTLINNTDNDGKPYLLTASHCLNKQFTMKNPDYEKIAGLATEEITTVMGKADIVRNTVKYVGRQVHMTYNNLYIHRGLEEQALKEHKVRFADSDDVDRIYEFLMSFEEMKNPVF